MTDWTRAVGWPAGVLIAVLVTAFVLSYFEPALPTLAFGNFVVALLAVGAWSGYRAAESGGRVAQVAICGLGIGVLCAVADMLLYGVVRGFGVANVVGDAAAAIAFVFWGSLLGGGYRLSQPAPPVPTRVGEPRATVQRA